MAYNNNQSEVIAKIKKNDRGEFIVVSKVVSDKGNTSVDVRQYYTNDDDEQLPTKKGIRVAYDLIEDVVRAMLNCMDTGDKQLLLDTLDAEIGEDGQVGSEEYTETNSDDMPG